MSGIEVHDLKYGSGVPLAVGDTIEFHFQVARRLDRLDTSDVLQTSWRHGRPLVVTLGSGALRPDIDRMLVGLPTGSDRRLLVPAGSWPDITEDVAISLAVVSIVPVSADGMTDGTADFDAVACSIPAMAPDPGERLNSELVTALRATKQPGNKEDHDVARLRLSLGAYALLEQLLRDSRSSRLDKYKPRDLGEGSGGMREVEVAVADAKRLLALLEREE